MKYQPMLAKLVKDEAVLLCDPDYICERKYDGHRGQLDFSVERGLHLWSRLGNDRIDDAPFMKQVASVMGVDVVLDGELLVPGGTSSDVADLSNRDRLVYVAFDVLACWGNECIGWPYRERRGLLAELVDEVHPRLQLSEVSSDPSGLLAEVKATGGEGIMMKRKEGVYEPGKRSWNWVKVKCWRTWSVIITGADASPTKWTVRPGHVGTDGVLYPEGKPSSTAGFVGLTYGFWDGRQAAPVGSLGFTGPREEMERYVGRVAEVKAYAQYVKTGALRHPGFLHWRDDVRPEECVAQQE